MAKSICQFVRIHMNFADSFLSFEFFFLVVKKRSSNEIWISSRELHSRNFWLIHRTRFSKIWKNSYVFEQIDKSILVEKKLRYQFFVQHFFHYFLNNFLELLIFKINVLSTFRMVDFLKIFVSSGSIPNTFWISLLAGNLIIHPL